MKHSLIIIAIAIFGVNFYSSAQVVGQDAEGFSTIVLPSSNLYLQVSDPKASFSFYAETWKGDKPFSDLKPEQSAFKDKSLFSTVLTQTKIDSVKTILKGTIWKYNKTQFNSSNRAKYFILGGEISGGISNGLSTLFSGGEFSTSNTITGLIGYNWFKLNYKNDDELINNYITSRVDLEKNALELTENEKAISAEIDKLVRLGVLKPSQKVYYMGFNNGNSISDIKGLEQFKKEVTIVQGEGQGDFNGLIDGLESVKAIAVENQLKASKIVSRDQLDTAEKALKTAITELKKANADVKDTDNQTKAEKKNIAEKTIEKTIEKKKKEKELKDLKKNVKNNLSNKKEIETKTEKINQELQLLPIVGNAILSEINTTISNNHYSSEKWASVITLLNKKLDLLEYSKDTANPSNFDDLISMYSDRITLLNKTINHKESQIENINEIIYYTRTILYARGGYNGASFKLDKMNDAATIDDRFRNVKFDGYTIQLGLTHQYRVYNYLGLSTSLSRGYNSGALSSSTYKFTSEDTSITTGTFSSSQEITAFSGTYDSFLRYSINADYVHLFSLKESNNPNDATTSHLYLSLNPYVRHHGYKRSETLKNNTVFGIGLHAFNSKDNKLMGGVFVQTNDTFGANKATPNALGNRFTFGLIAKFSFSGLKPAATN